MKKRLNADVLLPGDIILTTADAVVSKKIRTYTRSDISHAMLYVTHCSVIHAYGDGVHADNTQRTFFEPKDPVYVLRLKNGITEEKAKQICDYARELVGTEYSKLEAVRSLKKKGERLSEKQFCSRLVAQCYKRYGIGIVPNADYCVPGALKKSEALEFVQNVTLDVSDEELRGVLSVPYTPDLVKEAINRIFKEARKIEKSIQNFSKLGAFVKKNPVHDSAVRDIIVQSGYLDFWNEDRVAHPWRYDIGLMNAMPDQAQIMAYCLGTMKTESRNDNRFTKTLAFLRLDQARFPRQTFNVLISLYKKLAEEHAARIDTASLWLKNHHASALTTSGGPAVEGSPPHT